MSKIAVIRTPKDLKAWRSRAVSAGARVGLTPTMGALHAGHLSLVEVARTRAELVVASLFVNPSQFAPNEDFQAYPRDEDRDFALLAKAGCDAVYAPSAETVYPPGFDTTISVGGVSAPLEGTLRPHHFAGVATVVAKLLIQASPDVAVFGEKDYQQLQVIRRLVQDLDLDVAILAAPIIRETDGLALSSRNLYLSPAERDVAPRLHATLQWAAEGLTCGDPIEATEREAVSRLQSAGFDKIDYVEVRDPCDLSRLPHKKLTGDARLLAAAWIGRTRLIDNLGVTRRQVPSDA
jgi:pantoate--beta-alanine ligase